MVTVKGRSFHQLNDFSETGVFIKSEKLLKPGDVCCIMVELPGGLGDFYVDGIVKRVNWSGKDGVLGMGIQLDFSTILNQKMWESYVTHMRNQQIINVCRRLVDEFFKPKGLT